MVKHRYFVILAGFFLVFAIMLSQIRALSVTEVYAGEDRSAVVSLKNANIDQGDVDSSGDVDLDDALLALKTALKISPLGQAQVKLADMDQDGSVTLDDALLILRKALKIDQDAPETVALSFRNEKLLEEHYQKHGVEMGFASAKQYEAAANAVVNNPKALHKKESDDGDDVYYIESTNEFVVVSTDGYIRTYFYPDAGIDYFNRQ